MNPKPKVVSNQPPKVQHQLQISTQAFQGPIPDPESLAKYEAITPGLAIRLLELSEQEQKHRHSIQMLTATNAYNIDVGDQKTIKRGQIFAILGVILVLLFGVFLGYIGEATCATIVVTTVIVGLTAMFLAKNISVSYNHNNKGSSQKVTGEK